MIAACMDGPNGDDESCREHVKGEEKNRRGIGHSFWSVLLSWPIQENRVVLVANQF